MGDPGGGLCDLRPGRVLHLHLLAPDDRDKRGSPRRHPDEMGEDRPGGRRGGGRRRLLRGPQRHPSDRHHRGGSLHVLPLRTREAAGPRLERPRHGVLLGRRGVAAYSFGQLEDLWVQAGGPRSVAPVMAAIGLAESGGRNVKQKGQPLSRTGWGIWQITPGDPSLLDPHRNARAAVAKYRSQGLRAWTTYTTGRYKAYLVSANSGQSAGFGILTPGNFAGVDQGVDYRGAGPVPALDA